MCLHNAAKVVKLVDGEAARIVRVSEGMVRSALAPLELVTHEAKLAHKPEPGADNAKNKSEIVDMVDVETRVSSRRRRPRRRKGGARASSSVDSSTVVPVATVTAARVEAMPSAINDEWADDGGKAPCVRSSRKLRAHGISSRSPGRDGADSSGRVVPQCSPSSSIDVSAPTRYVRCPVSVAAMPCTKTFARGQKVIVAGDHVGVVSHFDRGSGLTTVALESGKTEGLPQGALWAAIPSAGTT